MLLVHLCTENRLWKKVEEHFESHPERLAVAKILVENGLSVKEDRIFCNEIEIATINIARISGVDRRTVKETVKMINKTPELQSIFGHLRSSGHSLKEIAKYLNLGVVEITPTDARTPGILASSATLLAKRNICIRQALVDDPELSPEPKLTLITEVKIPGDLISELLKIMGVEKVSVF